jgi:hypothetical protein
VVARSTWGLSADDEAAVGRIIGDYWAGVFTRCGIPRGLGSSGSGVDIRTVAALLRHSSPATTLNVAAHEMEGAQADAVLHLLGADGNRMATAAGRTPKSPREISALSQI